MRAPSSNPITMIFGATTAPYTPSNPHKGTDFGPAPDNIIYAPFEGAVTLIPNNGNDGNGVYMTDSAGRYHGFLHTSKYLVFSGSRVQQGQPLAVMGYSGYVVPQGPGGTHLHWAVKQNGKFIDPMSLVNNNEELTMADITTLLAAIEDVKQTELANRENLNVIEIAGRFEDLKANTLDGFKRVEEQNEDNKRHILAVEAELAKVKKG